MIRCCRLCDSHVAIGHLLCEGCEAALRVKTRAERQGRGREMSLGSTWLRAEDGRMYKNPVLRGIQIGDDGESTSLRWFLCFSDKEPPELVAEIPDDHHVWPPADRRHEPLHEIVLSCFESRGRWRRSGNRVFAVVGEEWDFKPACSVFGELMDRIPIPQKFDDVADEVPLPGYVRRAPRPPGPPSENCKTSPLEHDNDC